MKSVLISIHPRHCEKIVSGKKTVEVRKTKPWCDTPFKCYIYETKDKNFKNITTHWNDEIPDFVHTTGKVIGEFVCDFFDEFEKGKGVKFKRFMALHETCLDVNSILKYMGEKDKVYGWHISDLKIYDKPKELKEFNVVDKTAVKHCKYRTRTYINPDFTKGAQLKGGYICSKNEVNVSWCKDCLTKNITRSPQSWCYVETRSTS